MDDVWVRLGLVAGALAVAGLIALWQRARSNKPPRQVSAPRLDPGIYLFSSTACPTCGRARKTLQQRFDDDFTELVWEEEPGIFAELGIDAVPAVMVLGERQDGTIYFGQPPRTLAAR